MSTPKIKTVRSTDGYKGIDVKGFEMSVKFTITYDDLLTVIIHILSLNNTDVKNEKVKADLYTKITKTNIIKFIDGLLWMEGVEWFSQDNVTSTEINTHQKEADTIIYQYWKEIWQDHHNK